MKSYRELIVWQKAISVCTQIYELSKDFPKEEKYGLSNQMKRSAISISSNIAEGYGRNSTKDYRRFLLLARGSLFELQTQIEIALNIGMLNENLTLGIEKISTEIEKMLNSLIKKLS